jgi:hypothetical protein
MFWERRERFWERKRGQEGFGKDRKGLGRTGRDFERREWFQERGSEERRFGRCVEDGEGLVEEGEKVEGDVVRRERWFGRFGEEVKREVDGGGNGGGEGLMGQGGVV